MACAGESPTCRITATRPPSLLAEGMAVSKDATVDDATGNGTIRHGLLALLLTKGLIAQPEVTVTTSIAWLAQRHGSEALRELVAESTGGRLVLGSDPV